jgi:hypothetical protein
LQEFFRFWTNPEKASLTEPVSPVDPTYGSRSHSGAKGL